MSIAGIGSTNVTQLSNIQRNYQQVQSEFKQLGQDLQTGNLTQAQTDFVTLSQSVGTQFGSNSPIAKTLETIGQALQSGNLSSAQQAFNSLSPTATGAKTATHHHHHVGNAQNSFEQLWNQLGQALQSGNLSAAQQAFSAVQQMWQQGSANSTPASAATTATL
ncbi:MAG TPA: hypothetical protein VKV05_04365 [Terriglobales bacterium]|nr:hypothetical protein [Terriglobales bacterium]